MPVKEVAARVGYEDPLYFSRLFRRRRGVPPSALRLRVAREERAGQ